LCFCNYRWHDLTNCACRRKEQTANQDCRARYNNSLGRQRAAPAAERRLGDGLAGVAGIHGVGIVGKRGQQRLVGQDIDAADDALRGVGDQPGRGRAEQGRAFVAGRAQAEGEEIAGQVGLQGRRGNCG
jgi:hypothetical protein